MPNKLRAIIKQIDRNKAKLLSGIGELIVSEALQNFKDEAFEGQKWKPRKDGSSAGERTRRRNLLVQSGKLRRSIRVVKVSKNSVTVGSDVPYAKIHNEGGVTHPKISPKMRRFAWAMYYKNKGSADKNADSVNDSAIRRFKVGSDKANFWKNLALTPKTSLRVEIPARPFLRITPLLREKIKKKILDNLFKLK
jgi:phage gpG-like protein